MNTGIVKSKASGLALMGKVLVAVAALVAGGLPQHASASPSNAQLEQYIIDFCGTTTSNLLSVQLMCSRLAGYASSGGANVSANLGIASVGGEISTRKRKGVSLPEEDQNNKSVKGASADDGGWGLLVAPQYGKNERTETDLENGYQSNLSGLLVGTDYRFSDRFVLGATIALTKDDATFLNNAGALKTGSTVFTMYGTWLPSEVVSFDGYLGFGKIKLETSRVINWVTNAATDPPNGFFGTVNGDTTGQQIMAGISASLQKKYGRLDLSPSISLDYIKTSINGYNESGTTTIEMHYADRTTASLISSLGVRLGGSFSHEWGMLLPYMRVAAVHEFQSNAQQVRNELVISPGTGFSVATDAPDRNYLNLGLGVVAALDSGAQLFLDYDKRTQDKLLSSWAVSLGVLLEF
ncbi:MAG: autotransporter outer membrane beta-barrel domain-containing protein [Gallionellaceae bacterium]|nr:autotransporter outer membrane beta-barrel domain-containing protein [Gallionellaceae bacterium]